MASFEHGANYGDLLADPVEIPAVNAVSQVLIEILDLFKTDESPSLAPYVHFHLKSDKIGCLPFIPIVADIMSAMLTDAGGYELRLKCAIVDSLKRAISCESSSSSVAHSPLDMFLLLGQSNMAGRVQEAEFASQDVGDAVKTRHSSLWELNGDTGEAWVDADGYTKEELRRRIYAYNPVSSQWSNQASPFDLHRPVDVCKEPGLGPGSIFAAAMVLDDHQNPVSASESEHMTPHPHGCVGLIPAAIGSTEIREWLPQRRPSPSPTLSNPCLKSHHGTRIHTSASQIASAETESTSTESIPPLSLVHCALRTTFAALAGAPTGSVLRGILWYQGENDTLDEGAKEDYACLFHGLYVFLQTGIGALHHLLGDRDHSSEPPPPLSVVPPPSSSLFSHIPMVVVGITAARPWLIHLAAVRRALLETLAALNLPLLSAVDAFGLPLQPDAIHLAAGGVIAMGKLMAQAMRELLSTQASGAAHAWHIVGGSHTTPSSLRSRELFEGCASAVRRAYEERMAAGESPATLAPKRRTLSSTGLKPVSFVHGSLDVCSVRALLDMVASKVPPGRALVDLGCGEGAVLAAAMMHSPSAFSTLRGVELLRGKMDTCRDVLGMLSATLEASMYIPPAVELIEDNFLEHSDLLCDASVIYACATCYAPDLMAGLQEMVVTKAPVGAYVIFIDKWLRGCPGLETEACMQVSTSWGAAMAFVMRRV